MRPVMRKHTGSGAVPFHAPMAGKARILEAHTHTGYACEQLAETERRWSHAAFPFHAGESPTVTLVAGSHVKKFCHPLHGAGVASGE